MTHVFHRFQGSGLPVAIRSEDGPYLVDSAGNRYLDGSSGAVVSVLGHGHPRLIDAVKSQLEKIAFAHSMFFTTEVLEELADYLAQHAPGNLNYVYFVSGGSEANEAAIKMARQYFLEKGEPTRTKFIARRQSYHGSTLGALSLSMHTARRRPYEPILLDVRHIAPCYAYRHKEEGETDLEYAQRSARELEYAIQQLGPQTVAAFFAETIVGATLGAVPAVATYFREIRDICDRYGVLLVLDEVMCGMGRSGTQYAFEAEGIVPDLVTVAKGLGAGIVPIGAVVVQDRVFRAFADGSKRFEHGHTYMGHAGACAAALAAQKVMHEDGVLAKSKRLGAYLEETLRFTLSDIGIVGDIRGRGLFWGIEFVADRTRKTPFPPDARFANVLKTAALEQGLICYPGSGSLDGVAGDHVLIAPPLTMTAGHVDELAGRLKRAISTAAGKLQQTP